MREGEPVFGKVVVRVLAAGTAGLSEFVVRERLAGTGDIDEQTIEQASCLMIGVHAQFDKFARKPAAQ